MLAGWLLSALILPRCDARHITREQLQDDPIRKLYEVYVAVNQEAQNNEGVRQAAKNLFLNMERGDLKHLEDWEYFRNISIQVSSFSSTNKLSPSHFSILFRSLSARF